MLRNGTRVVKIARSENQTHNIGTLGSVIRKYDETPRYVIKWDGDPLYYIERADHIINHQGLKRIFKHGPKLTKSGTAA